MSRSYKIAIVLAIGLFVGIVSYHWLPTDRRRNIDPIHTSNAPLHDADQNSTNQAKKTRQVSNSPAQPGIGNLMVRIRSHMDRANRIASRSPTSSAAQTSSSVAAESDRVTVSDELKPAARTNDEIASTVPTITFDHIESVPRPIVITKQVSGKAKKAAPSQETPLSAPFQAHRSATTAMASRTPTTYTIETGDTFSTVAVKIYGSEKQWADIAAANPFIDPRRLQVGQAIRLPIRNDILNTNTHPTATPMSKVITHIVRSGDSLSSIAHRYYDAADQWRIIYDTNRETIGHNPNRLRTGDVLEIPPKHDQAPHSQAH